QNPGHADGNPVAAGAATHNISGGQSHKEDEYGDHGDDDRRVIASLIARSLGLATTTVVTVSAVIARGWLTAAAAVHMLDDQFDVAFGGLAGHEAPELRPEYSRGRSAFPASTNELVASSIGSLAAKAQL